MINYIKKIRKKLSGFALNELRTNYSDALNRQPVLQQIARKWEDTDSAIDDTALMTDEAKTVYRDILERQRVWLTDKNNNSNIDEEIIRRHLLYLDLEEEKIELL